ncbi:MAG TPA: hypothetical protein VHW43_13820 [Puia sp.]|nr:hypothetical protein [Puia sp.]
MPEIRITGSRLLWGSLYIFADRPAIHTGEHDAYYNKAWLKIPG